MNWLDVDVGIIEHNGPKDEIQNTIRYDALSNCNRSQTSWASIGVMFEQECVSVWCFGC